MTSAPRRFLTAVASAVLAVGMLSISGPAGSAAPAQAQRDVIVLLAGEPAVSAAGALRDARGALAATQRAFLAHAKEKGVRAKSAQQFNLLINAVALTVPDGDVARLKQLPEVVAVHEDTQVRALTDVSVPLVGAPEVWEAPDPAGTPATGAGMTVAVIDTGVDYTHPDLGAGLGAGNKVIGGYDFVNGDADPMDDNGHGTHVAGIIAGKAAGDDGITGVAPGASILAYKALDQWGNGSTSDIMAAIEAAADPANPHRADVINMSLGGPGDGLDPLGLAATAAHNAGVAVVAAAGNSGPGSYTVGSPAAADGVIAVGASISNIVLPVAHLAGAVPALLQTYRGVLSANPPAEPVTAQLVDVGYGSDAELDAAGDLTGKIVRWNGYVADSLQNLWEWDLEIAKEIERRGAIALIGGQSFGGGPVGPWSTGEEPGVAGLAASDPGAALDGPGDTASGDLYRLDDMVVMGMDNTQYDELTRLLDAGTVEIAVSGKDITDQIASFSSRGPSLRHQLKPDLAAPGYAIRSTVPTSLFEPGQYYFSGTSMAAPHVAGAAALVRQLQPERTPDEIKSALMGSAQPLTGTGPTVHGTGRLDIPAAVNTPLLADPPSLSLGFADLKLPLIQESGEFTLRNTGDEQLTVRLAADDKMARVTPAALTLPARSERTVRVTITTARPATHADLTGFITATAGEHRVTVPYLLLARPLVVQANPDPSTGQATIYVYSSLPLAAGPEVTVWPLWGRPVKLTAEHVSGNWYGVQFSSDKAGAYKVTTRARTTDGMTVVGDTGFEVTPQDSRDDRWEAVGPYSMGGELTIAPSDPNTAIAVQAGKAAPWLTTDGGASWRQLNRMPVQVVSGHPMPLFDAADSDRWSYAVNVCGAGCGTILRTDDAGDTWRIAHQQDDEIVDLLADEQRAVQVAVGSTMLQVSLDGGDSWTAYPNDVDREVLYAAIQGDSLYLGTARGIWVRPAITSGVPGPAQQLYDSGTKFVAGLEATEDLIVASVWLTGIIGSADQGQTWTTLKSQFFPDSLHVSGNDLLMTDFGRGYLSTDGGQTWADLELPSRNAAVYDFDRWADGSFTIANTAGFYRADADGNYRRIGVQGGTVHDLTVSGGNLLAATDNGVYRTESPVGSPDWGVADGEGYIGAGANLLQVSPHDPNVVWMVSQDAFGGLRIHRSTDAGGQFQELFSAPGVAGALFVDPAEPDRVMVSFGRSDGKQGLAVTTDGGTTWKNLFHDVFFTAIAADPSDPGRIWLGTRDGLYRSTDGGVTVTKVTDGDVAAIHFGNDRMIVAGRELMKISTDGGESFRSGFTGPLPVWFADVAEVDGVLYAASRQYVWNGFVVGGRGALRSGNGGWTWHSVSSGLDNLDATSLAVSPDGSTLYVGTTAGGVHQMRLD